MTKIKFEDLCHEDQQFAASATVAVFRGLMHNNPPALAAFLRSLGEDLTVVHNAHIIGSSVRPRVQGGRAVITNNYFDFPRNGDHMTRSKQQAEVELWTKETITYGRQ